MYLNGKASLLEVFWFYGIFVVLVSWGLPLFASTLDSFFITSVVALLVVGLVIHWMVAIWVNASNTDWIGWGLAAKAISANFLCLGLFATLLDVFDQFELAKLIHIVKVSIDLLIAVIVLCVFLWFKIAGKPLSTFEHKDKQSDSGPVNQVIDSHVKMGKAAFRSGNYKKAAWHFEKAEFYAPLDAESGSLKKLCLKRLENEGN